MINLFDIQKARETIQDTIHTTPLMTSKQLSEKCGNKIFMKCEHLQKTGSFKIRGAANKVMHEARHGAKYVTAASSGNHGQAVAYIAQQLGIKAKIVIPEDAALPKIHAIRAYGASIEKCGTTSTERIPRAKEIAEKENGVFIPPYDDPYIMAGQGTIGLEILEQMEHVDMVLVPGGGGLISGILTAIKESKPCVKVIAVEPEIANDTYLSLQNKQITSIGGSSTIADGLRTSQPGELTFPIVQKYVDDIVVVSEEEIRGAFTFILERMKQLVEPSSATVVAAAMYRKLGVENKQIVSVLSGGNVELGKVEDYIL